MARYDTSNNVKIHIVKSTNKIKFVYRQGLAIEVDYSLSFKHYLTF